MIMPEIRNGTKESSLNILIIIKGIHATGEVFLIINSMVKRNVNMIVFKLNLLFYSL